MIKSGTTGYELIYELEEYKNNINKKISKTEKTYNVQLNFRMRSKIYSHGLNTFLTVLKEIGNNTVLNFKKDEDYIDEEIIKALKEINWDN